MVSYLETAMWTPSDRALVGDFGSGQALTDGQFRLLAPLIPPAKPGGRPRTASSIALCRGDGDLPLLKPLKGARLAAKPPISSECRIKPFSGRLHTGRYVAMDSSSNN